MAAHSRQDGVRLASGVWVDGVQHSYAAVRQLTGADEVLLGELDGSILPAERATILLTRTVQSIGEVKAIGASVVRELTVGDRERLLLALYARSFGHLDTTARCPDPSCGELFEVPLDPEDIVVRHSPSSIPPIQEMEAEVGGQTWRVRFRLPNGADQEVAARQALADVGSAAAGMVRRCVLEIADSRGRACDTERLSDSLRSSIEAAWARLDPAADLAATTACPNCNKPVDVVLDSFSLLTAELRQARSILLEVHRLASVYHWSEAAILRLPVRRRRRYLALIEKGIAA